MNKYEIMFIVNSNLTKEEQENIANQFEKVLVDFGAAIIEKKDLGKKELAYEVKKHKTGHYNLFVVEAPVAAINEFDRLSLINENMLRHLVTRL